MRHRASGHRADPKPEHRHDPARPTAPARPDHGFTLIEIVITITLMAIVAIAVLDAVATTVRVSSTSRSAAQVETALVNAADRVNRAPKRCDYTIYVQAAVQTQDWPVGSASVTHQYYIPGPTAMSTGSWAEGAPANPGCPGPAPTDLLVQRVTITLTTPDGQVRRTIQVVKSDV